MIAVSIIENRRGGSTYQGERGRPRARHTITRDDPAQQHLDKIFDVDRYAPAADVGNTAN